MKRILLATVTLVFIGSSFVKIAGQENVFSIEAMREDFLQFRDILEKNHCCLYEYTPGAVMDSLFTAQYNLIDHPMQYNEFFMLLAPVTAKVGCMHTATWVPGRYFITKPTMMFPLIIKSIGDKAVVTGSYLQTVEIEPGSILLEINKMPVEGIIDRMREIVSADALNPFFINAEIAERFSLLYASAYGLPDQYEVIYLSPGKTLPEKKTVTPASHESVRAVIYAKFNDPPLGFEVIQEKNTAIMTVPTFIYYDKVDYFRNFMDSCFHLIKKKGVKSLILDLRGNDGGDPFCSSVLMSYLQKSPVPYFAEEYGKYRSLADPLPMPEDNFKGDVYILADGSCGSTNGHFCALLKYHKTGMFIGTPTGSTYKCNAGKNTEFRLNNTQMIITAGRSTYSAAVHDMAKTAIMPDIYVQETIDDFIHGRDVFIIKALEQIEACKKAICTDETRP